MDGANYMEEMATKSSGTGGATLSFNPSQVRGMKGYQSGDKVSLQVDGVLGDADEDGMTTIQITRIVAEGANPAKMASRQMMSPRSEGPEEMIV